MKKTKLIDIAETIRSKNAGPYELTLDVIFKSRAIYQKIKKEQIINNHFIKNLYHITDDKILSINYFDPAKAVKITISRQIPSGSIGDTDVYGAQQHIPLANSIVQTKT